MELDILIYKKKKNTKEWRLNNMLQDNEWIDQTNQREKPKNNLETNEDENMMIKNQWDAAEEILSGSL